MSWSNTVEAAFLTQLTTAGAFGAGGDEITLTGDIYVALSTTAPAEDGTNVTEPDTGDGYAREQVTFGTVAQAADQATRSNTSAITHGPATDDWGSITHFALYDAVTGGNYLGGAELDNARNVLSGDSFVWAIGQLTIGNS